MPIVFKDPPPQNRGRASVHPWEEIAAALRERPGEWALCVSNVHDSTASAIRTGKIPAFPLGEYESRAVRPSNAPDRERDPETGRLIKRADFDLYIRYVGNMTAGDIS